ncbi:unnamed protein product [Anisakis simplex]|uniref:MFS domain-containing protein n=1 Tax=Anisakis simplex TaxID=6269 RepID=A0A0M3KDH3_ANISI|nr:unnamed protein product [Anisakis simplex]
MPIVTKPMISDQELIIRGLQIGSFVFIACNFIASIFGALAVDRFGRRPLLLSFALCNTLSLCAYCVFDRIAFYVDEQFKYGCIASLIAYGITFGGGLGPIAFFITTELVPQQFRSAVQSMVFTTNTAVNFVFSLVTLPLYDAIDIWSLIPLFIGPSFVAWIYLLFKLPETRGREIHEIVRELVGTKHEADFDSNTKSSSPSNSIKDQSVSFGNNTESSDCTKQSQVNTSVDSTS